MKTIFKLSLIGTFAAFITFVLIAQDFQFPGRNPSQIPGTQQRIPTGTGGTNIYSNPFNTYYQVNGTNLYPIDGTNLARIQLKSTSYVTTPLPTATTGFYLLGFDVTTGGLDYFNPTNFFNNTTIDTINVTNITVIQDFHVGGKATLNQIILTNGFFAQTNVWSGPSNNVDISIYDQEYGTLTSIQFNGIINSSNSLGGEVKMTIGNISSSNITAYAAAGFVFASGDTTETITNGHRGIFWINQDPALGGQTNVVFQHF